MRVKSVAWGLFAAVAGAAMLGGAARGDTLIWNPPTKSPSAWDTTSLNWRALDSSTQQVWVGTDSTDGDTAIFDGQLNDETTVVVHSGITLSTLSSEFDTYTFNGSSPLTFVKTFFGPTPSVSGSVVMNVEMTGAVQMILDGAITINKGATYSGGTRVESGAMTAGVNNALPSGGDIALITGSILLTGFNQSAGALDTGGAGNAITVQASPAVTQSGIMTVTSLAGNGTFHLNNNGVLIVTTGQVSTFGGSINPNGDATNGGLVKGGAGELILLGTANLSGAYTGPGYDVDQGTLAGNTTNLNHGIYVNTGATLLFAQGADGTFNGAIDGGGTVRVAASGSASVLTLTQASTMTGQVQILTGATVAVDADAELGTQVVVLPPPLPPGGGLQPTVVTPPTYTYATLVLNGGTLRTVAGITSLRPVQVTANGGTIDTDGAASTFSGIISSTGAGVLEITGGGTVRLGSVSDSINALQISGSGVTLAGTQVALDDIGGTSFDLNVIGGTLSLLATSSVTTVHDAHVSGTGVIALGGATTKLTVGGDLEILQAGVLSVSFGGSADVAGAVNATGASINVLDNSGLHSGAGSVGAAPMSNTVATISGGGSAWTVTGGLTLGVDAVAPHMIVTNGLPLTVPGSAAGMGTLNVTGGGSVTVGGTLLAQGASTIAVTGGQLQAGVLQSSNGYSGTAAISDAGSPKEAALILGSDTAGDGTFAGVISNGSAGAGSIVKVGGNTQTLSGANSYSGATTVNGGALVLTGATASSDFEANAGELVFSGNTVNLGFNSVTAASGGTVQYNGASIVGGFLFGPGTHSFSQGASLTGTQIFNGATVVVGGATFKSVTSAGSILVNSFGGGLTWTGGTNAGTLDIALTGTASVSSFTSSGVIHVEQEGRLNVTSGNLLLSGGSRTTIDGGSGRVQLPGAVNVTGGNTIQLNGGLLVNNGVVTGETDVNFGGVAKGSGTYGAVVLGDGGTFSPGNSPGEAHTGAVTWGAGGHYQWQISDATGSAGVGYDHWTINGALAITAGTTTNAKFAIDIATLDGSDNAAPAADFDATKGQTWEIAAASGGITGFNAAEFALNTSGVENSLAGGSFSVMQTGDAVDVVFTPAAVPEPASAGLLVLGISALLARARAKLRRTSRFA